MTEIPVSREKPPVFDKLALRFGIHWDDVIIAYGGKIHSNRSIPPQKVVHEKVHLDEQDRIGNDAWWNLYFDSDQFRLEQELLAHKAEADFIKKNIKNREIRFHAIRDIASSLSSSMYGNILDIQEAMRLLTR